MKLLPSLWLLCGLLLVVGDQDPPVAPALAPKAPIADNSTVAAVGKPTSAPAGATGNPSPPAGSPEGKVQTSAQSAPNATKIEPQQAPKEAPAAPETTGKNRKRTNTDSPKGAGDVAASTAKPAVVESKASTAAVAASGAPPSAAPYSKPKDAPVSPTSGKNSTLTTTTAKPAAGSAIVADGQSMKDVTKPNNSTSKSTSSSTSSTSTTASTKTTSTTTPKPTKPPVVYSMGTHSEWEKDQEQGKDGEKPPLAKPVSTLAEPVPPQVQELTGNLSDRGDTGYVVPIVTVLLTVPLAIGVVTIMYRRFRDMWSTRHYRRMDFLVDGMYND